MSELCSTKKIEEDKQRLDDEINLLKKEEADIRNKQLSETAELTA